MCKLHYSVPLKMKAADNDCTELAAPEKLAPIVHESFHAVGSQTIPFQSS